MVFGFEEVNERLADLVSGWVFSHGYTFLGTRGIER